jgi:hypothetical protein
MAAPIDPKIKETARDFVDALIADYKKHEEEGNLSEEVKINRSASLLYMAFRSVNAAFSEREEYFTVDDLERTFAGLMETSEPVN